MHAQSTSDFLPKDVAKVVVNHHLAQKLAEMCNDLKVDAKIARNARRAALSSHDQLVFSQNSYSVLEERLGEAILVAAQRLYYERMSVSVFNRSSACKAGQKAIKDEQDVGKFLKTN